MILRLFACYVLMAFSLHAGIYEDFLRETEGLSTPATWKGSALKGAMGLVNSRINSKSKDPESFRPGLFMAHSMGDIWVRPASSSKEKRVFLSGWIMAASELWDLGTKRTPYETGLLKSLDHFHLKNHEWLLAETSKDLFSFITKAKELSANIKILK